MRGARTNSTALNQSLAGQMSLFAAYSQPSFDEMCPPIPGSEEQLGLDVEGGAEPRTAGQMSTYDYDC